METKAIDNFLKGVISRVSADKISDNAFSDCCNIDLSENYLPKSIKGKIKVNSVVLDNKQCQGIVLYENKEMGSLLVVACGGYIYYSKLNTDNFQKYKIDNAGVLEDVKIDEKVRVRFTQYNDRLFVFCGKYPVIENEDFYNACILVLYKNTATFINRDSFYAWTKSGQIFYTLSQTPASGDVIFSDLYRTKLNVLVASYDSSNNKFTDTNGDQYIRTTNSDKIDNNVPQGLKIGFVHQERLFGLGSMEDDNGVYWSQPYDPTRWTPMYGLNYDTVGKDDGEIITGGASFGGVYVYIFKRHNVYRYLTSGDIDQWQSNKVDTTYGCVAHETIRLFNGCLTYLSTDGVAQLNGNTAILIDEQIRDKIASVSVGEKVEVERSFVKNSNWDELGSSTKGIIVSNNKISAVKDFDVSEFANLCESHSPEMTVENGLIHWRADKDYSDNQYSTFSLEQTGGSTFTWKGTRICLLGIIVPTVRTVIERIKIFVEDFYFGIIGSNNYSELIFGIGYEKTPGNPVTIELVQSIHLTDRDLQKNSWNVISFFSTQPLEPGRQYYIFMNLNLVQGLVPPDGTTYFFRTRTFTGSMPAKYLKKDNFNTDEQWHNFNQNLWCKVYGVYFNQIYKSKEIDLKAISVNFQHIVITKEDILDPLGVGEATLEIANYPQSSASYDGVDSAYKTQYTISDDLVAPITIDINVSNAYRYLRFSIIAGEYRTQGFINFFFKIADNYDYQTKPLQITAISNLPKAWGISQFIRTGTDDIDNKATIYIRSGNDTTELLNATYYEINNNEQIPAGIELKCLIQFKVSFPTNSDNEISLIKIFFYTIMEKSGVCAIVYKNKYRLNIPKDNQSSENAIECIYDKDGYWTIKDDENNFDYCKSNNDLFSASASKGQVYKKEIGYKNDNKNYDSYFITKRFVLSDFENLYRKFKVRYISSVEDITVGVSVDGGEFVDYIIPKKSNLFEMIKTLVGIVRGQTIQFKFSWQANDSTQIHNLMWYWQVLRELNRG